MTRFLVATSLVVGMFAFQALAADPPSTPEESETPAAETEPAETAPAPEADCTVLEGDEKAECEAAKASAAEAAEAAEVPKGAKAKRSTTNRMEAEATDE